MYIYILLYEGNGFGFELIKVMQCWNRSPCGSCRVEFWEVCVYSSSSSALFSPTILYLGYNFDYFQSSFQYWTLSRGNVSADINFYMAIAIQHNTAQHNTTKTNQYRVLSTHCHLIYWERVMRREDVQQLREDILQQVFSSSVLLVLGPISGHFHFYQELRMEINLKLYLCQRWRPQTCCDFSSERLSAMVGKPFTTYNLSLSQNYEILELGEPQYYMGEALHCKKKTTKEIK